MRYMAFLDIYTFQARVFENILGKEGNAGNQHFLLFSKMFSTILQDKFHCFVPFILSSAGALNLDLLKVFFFFVWYKVTVRVFSGSPVM